jgi:hypothetical protein
VGVWAQEKSLYPRSFNDSVSLPDVSHHDKYTKTYAKTYVAFPITS